jgi:hypothetical protein
MEISSRLSDSELAPDATLARLDRLAWLLDNSIPIPGLRFRVGLDALIGLIPVIGDALGVLISGYILREAGRLGAPAPVLLRMAFNLAIDGLVGMIPFAGDLFDAGWKANQRNVRLLRGYLIDPRRTSRASAGVVAVLGLLVAAFLLGTGILSFFALRWLLHTIGAI